MRSPREKIDLEKCVFIEDISPIDKFRFSDFWIDGIIDSHFLAIVGIPTDEGFDISFPIFHYSDDER